MTRHTTSPTLAALRARFAELYGNAPPPGLRATILTAAIAWREQVLDHGDIAPALVRDLAIVARECRERRLAGRRRTTPPRIMPTLAHEGETPQPAPGPASHAAAPPAPAPLPPASAQLRVGAKLVRSHAGVTHVVEVTGDGFLYDGQTYRSLSAVARAITGAHWNGLLFFGLRRRKTPGGSTTKRRRQHPVEVGAIVHG